jgi:hypothetical protein
MGDPADRLGVLVHAHAYFDDALANGGDPVVVLTPVNQFEVQRGLEGGDAPGYGGMLDPQFASCTTE